MRRALVTLPEGVWSVIDSELKGKTGIGDGDSEVIRNVVVNYLTEKGYLLPSKNNGGSQIEKIADELEMQNKMVEALVEVLEEKGALRYSDWESRIKKKLQTNKSPEGKK
jgi:hypothetical protein